MANFIVIILAFFIGYFAKSFPRFPSGSAVTANQFIIFVSLPALIISKLSTLLKGQDLQIQLWVVILMPWIFFVVSWIFFGWLGKIRNWSSAKTGALILTSGLGNTSFVGFPLLEATLGPQAIPYGILIDQLGSFLILATLGIIVASIYSGTQLGLRRMSIRVLSFPPFLSLLFVLAWASVGFPGEKILLEVFDRFAATLVPLALFSVGFQTELRGAVLKSHWRSLTLGISFKMLLMPLFFYFFYSLILDRNDLLFKTTILESAMATQIASAVVANEFKLHSELANLMVSLTIPISLLTIPLVHFFILAN